ncbi:hypothetical protein [Streptomyces sp. NPDC048603]|uniref:hypothetical protein n=1 Tax=Streptomyces sp. NPDC048603 TaxID=3365577 RepID=UPI00371D0BE3
MEELAYVLGKVVKGAAGLAYAVGDLLVPLGPEGDSRKRKRTGAEDGADRKTED